MTLLRRPPFMVNGRTFRTFDPNDPYWRNDLQFYADLWHPEQQGYLLSYDGNDYLSATVANFRSADSQGYVEVWFRSSTVTDNQTLFASADTSGTGTYFFIDVQPVTGFLRVSARENAGTTNTVPGLTNVCNGRWHHIVLSSSGTAWTLILDGVIDTGIATAGSNTGDWFADIGLVADRNNISIGILIRNVAINPVTGGISSVRIGSRPMLQPEAATNYARGRKAGASDTTGLVYNLPCTEGTGNPVDTVGGITMVLTGATWVEGGIDRSPNAYPITLFGGSVWSNQGRTLALNKYGIVTAPALNFTTGDFSGWAWVKTTDLTTHNVILSRGIANTDGWYFHIKSTGALTFTTAQGAAGQESVSSANVVVTNTFRLLGFSRAGAVVKLWANVSGQMVDVTTTSGSHTNPLTSARTLKLGAYDDLTLALIGTMGEADVSGVNFTQQQFQQIFNATRFRYGV